MTSQGRLPCGNGQRVFEVFMPQELRSLRRWLQNPRILGECSSAPSMGKCVNSPRAPRVRVHLLSSLGVFIIRIRILMYPACILKDTRILIT